MPIHAEAWPTGTPCWVDLSVPNIDAATTFYTSVLGWTLEDQGENYGHYHLASIEGHQAAGLGPPMEPGQPSVWTLYFSAPDLDAAADAVTENGGTVLVPPMEVGPMGAMAVALDPTGAAFGLWRAGTHTGVDVYNQPGALTWEDLRSPDPDAARAFYTALAAGVPVDGVGSQAHLSTRYGNYSPFQIANALDRFAELGVATALTEVDVRNLMPETATGDTLNPLLQAQAYNYSALLQGCLSSRKCLSYTVWGFDDGHSWTNTWDFGAGPGAEAMAAIYDENYQPKLAFRALQADLAWAGPPRVLKRIPQRPMP